MRNQAPAQGKLIFGKRWKIYQEQVTKRDLYNLSVRNQDLLKTMLQQQSHVIKMNESSTTDNFVLMKDDSNSFTHRVVQKRPFCADNNKRKKRFKSAAELGLKLD